LKIFERLNPNLGSDNIFQNLYIHLYDKETTLPTATSFKPQWFKFRHNGHNITNIVKNFRAGKKNLQMPYSKLEWAEEFSLFLDFFHFSVSFSRFFTSKE